MKSIKFIGFAICILVFIACDDNRTTYGTEDRNRTNQSERVDRTDQRNQTANQRNQGASNTAAQNNQRVDWDREMTQLYGHLNMNQDQINSYERMQRENRSQATSAGQNQSVRNWESNRDQSLREILTQEQYQRYEQWKRDNQNQNQNRNTNY